ncbi:MAG TPA: hypothetical protein VIM02_03660 [Rhizomicrobium sp.]|jgi:hypothetical protein
MSEFMLPLAPHDLGWIELRDRLGRAARELHFFAVSNEAVDGASLLVIAGNLARLAMSIPMGPAEAMSGGLVDASTLLAAQVLQREPGMTGSAVVIGEGE